MRHVTLRPCAAALTIAGSDSGGGAGVQADLKTFSAWGIFGTSAITAITAQNLAGVRAIQPVDPEMVANQILAVLEGFPVQAIKTGMLFSKEIITAICDILSLPAWRSIPLIVDPVFAATSGGRLIQDDAISILTERLFPRASLITPNIPEAEHLTQTTISNEDDLKKTGLLLHNTFKTPVLMKGGHLPHRAIDIFIDETGVFEYTSQLIHGVNNHGSGCTLSAAIAAALACGLPLNAAVSQAKRYITNSLRSALPLSPDIHIINHFPEN